MELINAYMESQLVSAISTQGQTGTIRFDKGAEFVNVRLFFDGQEIGIGQMQSLPMGPEPLIRELGLNSRTSYSGTLQNAVINERALQSLFLGELDGTSTIIRRDLIDDGNQR